MFCKHCGSQVDAKANFCSNCGRGLVEKEGQPDSSSPSFFSKPVPSWFKIFLATVGAIGLAILLFVLFSEDLTDTVDGHLKALRSDHFTQAYYNYTSKDFQEAVSLEKFRDFFTQYPIFSQSDSVRFIERNVNHSKGNLDALLLNKQGIGTLAQYHLVKEGDKWKIFSIKLEEMDQDQELETAKKHGQETTSNASSEMEAFDETPVFKVVHEQLEAIRRGELTKAYQEFSSQEFKKATSLEEFTAFIHSQPGFGSNEKADWGTLKFDNNIALLDADFFSKEGQVFEVDYNLVLEDNRWKILHIEIVPQLQGNFTAHAKPLKFDKFVFGTSVNDQGLIVNPSQTFDHDDDTIYLNLYISQGKEGTPLEVILSHEETRNKVAPVKTSLTIPGGSILTILFSASDEQWPLGTYRVEAHAQDTDAEARFTID